MRSAPAASSARVRSRSRAAAAGPRRGGGGACSTCPSSPSPRPKLKNNKKQLITPKRSAARRAEGSACGARTQQAARMAGRGLGRTGTRGPASGGEALPLFSLSSGACSCRQCRLCCRRLYIPAQAQPPLPPPPRARPGRSYERCPGAAGKTRTGLAAPSPPTRLPPRLTSLLPPPPSQRSSGHLDAAGSEAGAAAAAPRAPRALTRSTPAQLPGAPCLRLFPPTLQKKKKDDLPALVRRSGFRDAPPGKSAIFLCPLQRGQKLRGPGGRIWPRPPAQVRGGSEIPSLGLLGGSRLFQDPTLP